MISKTILLPALGGFQLTVQEQSASLIVGCDALQERQRIADSI